MGSTLGTTPTVAPFDVEALKAVSKEPSVDCVTTKL